MTVKMFGTRNCPDVRAALETIAEKGLDVEFVNIDESTANLKLFLRLRDKAPEFDEVKKNGKIGVPCFVDGKRIFFDINEL